MSFILDALKKSDAERQKRSTPGFADIPVSRHRRQPPRWLWVVGGLLAVNLVVLVVLLVRPDANTPSTLDEAPAKEQAAAPAREARRPFADIVAEARQNAPPATAPGRDTRQEPAATARSDPAADAQRTAGAGTGPAAGERRNDAVKATLTANTFESLRADGTLSLPDLHLDIHVYSEQPADRFVFINMKKYRENETLAEGPIIRQIAPEGVLLEHRGTAFLLPRE